jgi:hypothetical protein
MPKILSALVLFVTFLAIPNGAEARRTPAPREPGIISRAEWGADESLGVVPPSLQENVTGGEEINRETRRGRPTQLSEKEKQCREFLRNNPEDFQVRHTEYQDRKGNYYVWPRRYSPNVKVFVVHHTGEHERSEANNLSGPERVRSIYKSHAVQNGWGDIGYHYLIDKKGNVYEGRAGGESVVSAHVYCANVATKSIALIGNFQRKHPTEKQLSSLRWLLLEQTQRHGVQPTGRTIFRGESIPTIVSHRDLASTQCAGRTIQKLLPAIRRQVAQRDYTTPLLHLLGSPRKIANEDDKDHETANTLSPIGDTMLRLPPRGAMTIKLKYKASAHGVQAGESIADVTRSDKSIGVWQQRSGSKIRVRNDVRAEQSQRQGESQYVTLTILAPRKAGAYTLNVGAVQYTIEATGRRIRSGR